MKRSLHACSLSIHVTVTFVTIGERMLYSRESDHSWNVVGKGLNGCEMLKRLL